MTTGAVWPSCVTREMTSRCVGAREGVSPRENHARANEAGDQARPWTSWNADERNMTQVSGWQSRRSDSACTTRTGR
jgi:hypothetical protein